MKKIFKDEYDSMVKNSEIIEKDRHGYKLMKLEDGQYLKFFRIKRVLSSATFYPYSKRFVKNAKALKQRDIKTVEVKDIFSIPHIKRTAVLYEPLAGKIVREVNFTGEFAFKLATFIARLHNKGVFFRSVHLANIIFTPENEFGLIDISDMKVKKRPLNNFERVRNFKHLLRYKCDVESFRATGTDIFIEEYLKSSPEKTKLVEAKLKKLMQAYKKSR